MTDYPQGILAEEGRLRYRSNMKADEKGVPVVKEEKTRVGIERPEVSVAQIILLILSQSGKATFTAIRQHPQVKLLGAVRSENSFYTALARLKRRRMISRTTDHRYELTQAGEYAALKAYVRREACNREHEVRELQSTSYKLQTTIDNRQATSYKLQITKWDGKWRIVLFDVPESKRPVRDYLRGVLKRLGFREFQRSMWVWPYKLPVFLKRLLADPQMRKYTRAITTFDIDYDEDLRRNFRLS